jgi:N-acetylmuramoyl-L-alanine amidase
MIAAGDHRDAASQQVDADLRRDASPRRRILAIHDHEIDATLIPESRHGIDHSLAARLSDDVAEEEEFQHAPHVEAWSTLGGRGIFSDVPRVRCSFSHWIGIAALVAATHFARGENMSPVADSPDWNEISALNGTITRAEFVSLLDGVYAPRNAAAGLIDVREDRLSVVRAYGEAERIELKFAADESTRKQAPRSWRSRAEIGPAPAGRPLLGMRIALDPGHIGGPWARMEGRWFQLGDSRPVMEGSLALATAEHLGRKLTALGAEVLWVRRETAPTTEQRPSDFFPLARSVLAAQGNANPTIVYESFDQPGRGNTLQFQAELFFYRMSEIRARARKVNTELKPDLALCLHFNAESWGKDAEPRFAPGNHFHILVNGCYGASELKFDDQRHDLLVRLLGGGTREEQRIAMHVARVFAGKTALPPFVYRGSSAKQVGESPYVWARNLLANRLYRCPVVYLEPYVMNSRETWERVQAGDYEGKRLVAGSMRPSLVREYADAVAEGVVAAMR